MTKKMKKGDKRGDEKGMLRRMWDKILKVTHNKKYPNTLAGQNFDRSMWWQLPTK